MSRKPLIAGNWKMNKNVAEGAALAAEITAADIDYSTRDVLFAPPYTNIYAVSEAVKKMVAKHLLQHKMYTLKQVVLLLVKYLVI